MVVPTKPWRVEGYELKCIRGFGLALYKDQDERPCSVGPEYDQRLWLESLVVQKCDLAHNFR